MSARSGFQCRASGDDGAQVVDELVHLGVGEVECGLAVAHSVAYEVRPTAPEVAVEVAEKPGDEHGERPAVLVVGQRCQFVHADGCRAGPQSVGALEGTPSLTLADDLEHSRCRKAADVTVERCRGHVAQLDVQLSGRERAAAEERLHDAQANRVQQQVGARARVLGGGRGHDRLVMIDIVSVSGINVNHGLSADNRMQIGSLVTTHRTTEIHLDLPPGTLGAVVDEPGDARHPCPVVLIVAGSGPTDHNGNNPLLPTPIGNLRQIGEALAHRGIAAIRPAKRGIGLSAAGAPPEEEMTIDRLIDDAVAWLEFANDDGRWSPVLIAGHSEGALIAAAAAHQTEVDGYISLAGPADRAADILRVQLRRQLPDTLMTAADVVIDQLEAGQLVSDPPPELSALFRPSVQPYLISWFKFDPAQVVASLDVPALIVQGSDDSQVPADHAVRLAARRPDTQPVVVQHVDHLLVTTGTTTVDPRVIREVVQFVRSLVT